MTCNILYVSLFAFMFFARNVIAGDSINVPCANSEIDSDYRVVFDDSVLNHINLSDVALFLEKNYKHSVVYIDNRYIKGKDSLFIFKGTGVSASTYRRAGDGEVVSLCIKTDYNIKDFEVRLLPSKYLQASGDEKILIIDESSTVKAYIKFKSGSIVSIKLFHVTT